MNATHEQLTLFLGKVSRRAWLVILVECARDALWLTSLALLLLSLFHVIGFPVSAQMVLLVRLWLLWCPLPPRHLPLSPPRPNYPSSKTPKIKQ